MPPGGMHVLTYPRPATGLEAKFSLDYPLAAALLDGGCTLATFTDSLVRRPEITALYPRIHAAEDPSCRGNDPQFDQRSSGSRGFVEVEVHLYDGRHGMVRVDRAPGAPTRELSWDELRAKFIDCARYGGRVSDAAAGEAFARTRDLDRADDIAKLTALLR
jgi:2-methylcitrate dehydratase PrpD